MKQSFLRYTSLLLTALALSLALTQTSFGYSVLAHKAIIDLTWEGSLKPLLLQRFPAADAEQLRAAHAYAYGGALLQDMGYYPFGSKLFTDLTHYVRSGDFIAALIAEAQDINEYAFALGALAHYAADNEGHSKAVNQTVPMLFPKLRAKYGSEVTYVQSPSAHLKTEFGFDVLQVARGRYVSEDYHDLIGFKVARPVLERAFKTTYALEMKDLFTDLDLAIGTFRHTVSVIIPEMTKIAWEAKKDEIEKLVPGITREKFVYTLTGAGYEKEWGSRYKKPGFWHKTLALLIRVLPKFGPLKALAFKPPTPETERMFIASFDATLDHYRALLSQVRAGRLGLPNRNFDTARPTQAGEYPLADEAYAKLLEKLANRNFKEITPELRENILAFYGDMSAPIATKLDRSDWRKSLRAIDKLKVIQAQPPQTVRQ